MLLVTPAATAGDLVLLVTPAATAGDLVLLSPVVSVLLERQECLVENIKVNTQVFSKSLDV